MIQFSKPLIVEGINIRLRPVRCEDAFYIYDLRINSKYNRHLSKFEGNVLDQSVWIEQYESRNALGKEFYFIIERLDNGLPCGTIRLYKIESDHFYWGSWILDANKPCKAALESAILSFGLGFDILKKKKARIDVLVENSKAISFYRRFGMTQVGSQLSQEGFYFTYSHHRFQADYESHMQNLLGTTLP